ncbi:hypothetical protein K7X08_011584 [Anisodus acutangulus]|uniref:Ion transport domain-containing protein n=1 Tax=Anisodus acutangulus TaxID=402998 RepID=A0A9Q1RIP2_9SOLA|nr:hypothetical protein K7X08_011584 [Anisodus acutangulus]
MGLRASKTKSLKIELLPLPLFLFWVLTFTSGVRCIVYPYYVNQDPSNGTHSDHVITANSAKSYKKLTGTAWTYVYFVSFYLISVLWLLNLIVAFVLEAFQAEMDLEASANCADGEDKEERSERRRNVGTKTRSQLLHHMLSSELTECSNDNNP